MPNTYFALYRKYRPENLDDVVGQQVIVKTLKNSIKNNHISHAYLFTGPRGTGKTSIAKILAKTINCADLKGTTPCDKCVSCTQINLKQNVDIIEIDAASNNGVDEIREIRSKVNLVPSISKYKVYIIDEVHMLTTGAFNALLKTLEEPPAHIIFILATTEPHKIPITILSRCQRFDFKRINEKDMFKRLRYICEQEKIEIKNDALDQIILSSDGGMRDAISTLDQVVAYAGKSIQLEDVHSVNGTLGLEEISEFIDLLLNKNLEGLMQKIDYYNAVGKNLVKIIEELVMFLKNIMLFITAPDYFVNSQYNYQTFVKYESENFETLMEYIDLFNSEINEIKKSNMPKFLFELLIIKIVNKKGQNNFSLETNIIQKEKKEPEKVIDSVLNILNDKVNNEYLDKVKKIQKIRIDNTLARFNKQMLLELKEELGSLSSWLINPDYSQTVSIILDGTLKAVSDEYAIFVFETENAADLFNENIFEIENVMEQFINKKYKVIATDQHSWDKIKNEFNRKTRIFEYVVEPPFEKKVVQDGATANNTIDSLFGDVVEYEN